MEYRRFIKKLDVPSGFASPAWPGSARTQVSIRSATWGQPWSSIRSWPMPE